MDILQGVGERNGSEQLMGLKTDQTITFHNRLQPLLTYRVPITSEPSLVVPTKARSLNKQIGTQSNTREYTAPETTLLPVSRYEGE